MECRVGCGACCIAPSISSSISGMPKGKKAGERCIHLNESHECELFNSPLRPKVCSGFMPEKAVCGDSFKEAMDLLTTLV